ncbi:hypothetical protein UCDDA912_g04113 [Diaporthe ampelina]|uniref:Uncharacterized protein n=1 Tax=Diaporthe ampelina TaxID=1214573 RepID=A0A0G2FNI3_9PEZI|nr:hypothetical protein UCDDA912_g04113 [Diaporthe ampelina]
MCNSRSFRLYKNHDPQTLDLRDGEVGKRPDIIPTSRYTTSEKTTTTEQSPTEPPTTEPTTESTTAPTTEPTTAPTTEPTTEPTTSDSKTESSPTTTTETESSTTTISISLSVTTIPHSSKSTESFITKTLTIEPALKLKIRQGQAKKEEQQQQQQQQQPPQNPGRPAGPRHRRGHSIPEKFANVLVINDHAKQTAEGLCGSKGSLGPSFADARGRMYCDMDTKTLYPFCEGVGQAAGQGDGGDTEPCFDFGGSNMLRGAGVQRRQAPRVQDWRVSRGKGGR